MRGDGCLVLGIGIECQLVYGNQVISQQRLKNQYRQAAAAVI